MRKTILVFAFVLTATCFASFFPYPCFSSHTNLSKFDVFEINNLLENEIQSQGNQNSNILHLNFSDINFLLPIGSIFEICDLKTEQVFTVLRTGGKNHADVELASKTDFEIFKNTIPLTWERRPVLVKLNDFAFLPASLAPYPHGNSQTNNHNGHFCLHFRDSKTDGTKLVDEFHQKAIKEAEKCSSKTFSLFE